MFFITRIIRIAALAGLWSQNVQASGRTNKVCPMYGPSFPKPSNLGSSEIFKDATDELNRRLDMALTHGTSNVGDAHFNMSTFSIGMFSINDEGLVYQRHHTDPSVATSPVGVNSVNADTIYRIGSVSKLMTMYIFLITDGDRRLYHPITDFIPEFAEAMKSRSADSQNGVLPLWDEITIQDLATHTAGFVEDYGLDDIEKGGPHYSGLPPLPKSRIPKCAYQIGLRYYTCTREEFIKGMTELPAIFAVADTPSYSNAGYDVFGVVIENINGVPLEHSFNESLVKPLGLKGAYFTVPTTTRNGAIPVSEYKSGWNQELGPANADGGNFMSTNDMAIIGRAMMNSTLLPKSVTRRWMQPRLFTGDPKTPIGAPWEIYRWETPTRIYDFYTKEGEEGNYSTLFVLIPDLGFGFNVFTTGRVIHAGAVELLAGIVAEVITPAVEDVARQQANQNFGGRYSSNAINSSVTITTDDNLALKVTEWISNGTDFLKHFGSTNNGRQIDFRLWPNELYSGSQSGFTASWQSLPRGVDVGPLPEQCQTWLNTGGTQYGNVALGSFVFDIDQSSGKTTALRLPAFPITLKKETKPSIELNYGS